MTYEHYLQTPEWATLRNLVLGRAGGFCELCGKVGVLEAHHLTYDRLFDEELTDLAGVCAPCHSILHDERTPVNLQCLYRGERPKCYCPVCSYHKEAIADRLRLRAKLAREVNTVLHERVIGEALRGAKPWYAGLRKQIAPGRLPKSYLCKRTGKPAGLDDSCACDTCCAVRINEAGVHGEEGDPYG